MFIFAHFIGEKRQKAVLAALLLLLLLVPAPEAHGQKRSFDVNRAAQDVNYALSCLDETLQSKDFFTQQRQQRCDSLRAVARNSRGEGRKNALKQLAQFYSRVQADSAFFYFDQLEQVAKAQSDSALETFVSLGRADILALIGQYSTATALLEEVGATQGGSMDDGLRLNYFQTCRTVYGWMADFALTDNGQGRMGKLTQQYRDSIIALQAPGPGRDIVIADRWLAEGQVDSALTLSLREWQEADDDLRAYICANIAEAYRQNGNKELQICYLALTAISDLRHGVREYMALPLLAQLMQERGDYRRAYDYLICTLEDASVCKARLRSAEASDIFPIIDKAYKNQQKAQRRRTRLLIYSLVALAVMLAGAFLYLRKTTKKLAASRRQLARTNHLIGEANEQLHSANAQLHEANAQLHEANAQLVQTDELKEHYITYYLQQCRTYIDTLDNVRRRSLKMLKNRQFEELSRSLKDENNKEEEQKLFFQQFDQAFLDIHPDYVERFNALLKPDCQIHPKSSDRLSPDLRIYALIRMGITKTPDIAHFFNYSLATIYIYRSRIRQAARYDEAEFMRRLKDI